MSTSSKSVKLANKAPSSRLAALVSTNWELPSMTCRLQVAHSRDLKKSQRDAIWDLFEANMRDLYTASPTFGWDPEAKRKELFHSLGRFILVTTTEQPANLLAFTNFRFEVEEVVEEDIIYCYDLQVATSAQGLGIGKKLLNELDKFGEAFKMEKITLTVLKENTKAREFYKVIGFSLDQSSPDYMEEDEKLNLSAKELEAVDYQILSRSIALQL